MIGKSAGKALAEHGLLTKWFRRNWRRENGHSIPDRNPQVHLPIVDDDPEMRQILRDYLEVESGYHASLGV